MKHHLALTLAAFVLVLAAPSAFAVRIRIVDAPSTPSNSADCRSNPANTACSITNLTDTYTINFVDAALPGCLAAPGNQDGFTYCAILKNLTGSPLTALNFTFTVPQEGPDDDYDKVTCSSFPTGVSASFCPPGPLSANDSITASFAANPGVPNHEDAYLFIDFSNSPGTTSLTLSPRSVPEPDGLGLFGLGLLALGVACGWQGRGQPGRGNRVAR